MYESFRRINSLLSGKGSGSYVLSGRVENKKLVLQLCGERDTTCQLAMLTRPLAGK